MLEHRNDPAGEPDAAVRWATLDDLPGLLAGGRSAPQLRERFARGDRVAVLGDGDVIGYAWYRAGLYDEQGILFHLGSGEVWGYDGWIAEGARGRGNAPRLLRGASRALAAEGVTRVLLSVDNANEASIRATRAGGRVPIGSIWMLRVLGVSLRREAWIGTRPRWALYRGARSSAPPGR